MAQQNNGFLRHLTELLQQTSSPTALADRELTVLWANNAAQAQYPRLTVSDGLTFFLGNEAAKQNALNRLESRQPYLCASSLPLMDIYLLLTPIMGPEDAFYTQVTFFAGTFPVPEASEPDFLPHPAYAFSRQITDTARELSSTLNTLYSSLERVISSLPVANKINRSFNELQRSTFYLNRSARNMKAFYNSLYKAPSVPESQTDLTSFVREIGRSAEALADKIGHRFTAVLPEHPVYALVDQEELALALYNGISNAMQFAQLGERITLALEEKDTMLEFSITNSNGDIPVPENILCRAFEPFFSQSPGTTAEYPSPVGLGLGLSVIQSFAANRGGTASLRCEGNQTILTFSIAWLKRPDATLQLFDSSFDIISDPYSLYNVMLSEVIPLFDEIDPPEEGVSQEELLLF